MTTPPRLLILEDLPTDAELAIRELRQAQIDFESKRVETKEEFVKALNEFKPDIILSDFSLPQFNALEALELLKKSGINIPFILYTGSLTEEVAVTCMKAGAADYILKTSLKRLPSSILNALEKVEAQRAKEKAIAELKAREEQFRSIVETTNERIWEANAKGRMTYNNPAVKKLLGYSPKEMLDKSPLHFIHPEDRQKIHEIVQKHIENKSGWTNLVSRWRHKDGSYRYLESNSIPVLNDTGELLGYRGADRDVTERKLIERELIANEMRLAEAQRIAKIGSFEWNISNNKFIWSDEFFHILQIKRDSFGATLEDYYNLIPDDDLPLVTQKIQQVISEKRFTPYEHRIVRADGVLRDVYVTAIVVRNEADDPVKISGIIQDITERKNTEVELHKLAAIVESSNDAIISINLDDIISSWNRGAERVFGYLASEAIGKPISMLFPHKRSQKEIETYASIKAGMFIGQVETVRLRKDGILIPVSLNLSPIKDNTGKIIGISKIAHDITQRKQADAALRESEYKMRTLLANMTEGLVQVNNYEVIEFVNDRFCAMTGYSREELIGKITFDILYDEEGIKFIEETNRQRIKGFSSQYELCLKKKSGERINVIVGGAPIFNSDNEIIGTMGVFTDITERKRAEDQLLYDALHDGLTGLPNRTLFMDHLRMTIERSRRKSSYSFAVLFLDFDRFKLINDSLGHTEGDKLLNKISRRLERSLRPGDLVARIGGDEFTILLNELEHEEDGLKIAKRILNEMKTPFELSGREIFTSVSIGIALNSTDHSSADEMLRNADIAMYRAKSKGKSQYQIFDQEMHKATLEQLHLETEMRYAIDREEFCLYYQPIITLATNELSGFEALVRWNHPERGMVSPLEFIPIAEETGLILPIGDWILRQACRQLRKWQDHNSLASSIAVSVNLSCKQFLQADLANQVATILAETDLDPSCLKLEITESYILENTSMAVDMLNQLRTLGIEISLDDFGTGYSSLSYLHNLPIDYLKIDRSFISRMTESKEKAEIVQTIISLAQNLKMKVVAEGIETIEQLNQLKKLKCEYGQGYFFSKPLKDSAAALVNSAKADCVR